MHNDAQMLLALQQEIAPPPPVQPKLLNTKAMSVQLITRKPTTRHNDDEAAKAARSALGDDGITASTTLFKDNTSPIKLLLAEVGAVYLHHKKNTLPYEDRGPRLLPVTEYESYRDGMRTLIGDVQAKVQVYKNDPAKYDQAVANDVAFRNATAVSMGKTGRASPTDYPTCEQFCSAIDLDFRFKPLPDNSHWLFDVDEEDKRALVAGQMDVYYTALADLRARIEAPLVKLAETLRVQPGTDEVTGKRVGIFRDTTVTNVMDAVTQARSLCMGDESILAACDAVEAALPKTITDNIDVLRESPVVREQAARRLADVASKMGAFFGE